MAIFGDAHRMNMLDITTTNSIMNNYDDNNANARRNESFSTTDDDEGSDSEGTGRVAVALKRVMMIINAVIVPTKAKGRILGPKPLLMIMRMMVITVIPQLMIVAATVTAMLTRRNILIVVVVVSDASFLSFRVSSQNHVMTTTNRIPTIITM